MLTMWLGTGNSGSTTMFVARPKWVWIVRHGGNVGMGLGLVRFLQWDIVDAEYTAALPGVRGGIVSQRSVRSGVVSFTKTRRHAVSLGFVSRDIPPKPITNIHSPFQGCLTLYSWLSVCRSHTEYSELSSYVSFESIIHILETGCCVLVIWVFRLVLLLNLSGRRQRQALPFVALKYLQSPRPLTNHHFISSEVNAVVSVPGKSSPKSTTISTA